jgi:hypothetical protein
LQSQSGLGTNSTVQVIPGNIDQSFNDSAISGFA